MVTIEPIGLEHAAAVQALVTHPEIVATTLLPYPYPDNGAREWVWYILGQPEPTEERPFAILHNETVVGVCGFKDVSVEKDMAELGYWIGRPFWGQGYATAGGRLAVDVAFNEWGLKSLFATPLVRNHASCRVLEKLGFEFTGEKDNPYLKWEPKDQIAYYEITSAVWIERRNDAL
jgi:ribosomal-protein-alanine N-acetyltransferase